jgi:hypothetical protein
VNNAKYTRKSTVLQFYVRRLFTVFADKYRRGEQVRFLKSPKNSPAHIVPLTPKQESRLKGGSEW